MVEWSIYTGTEVDVGAVLALWQQAESIPTVTDSEDGLRLLLRTDPGALLVARADGEAIGALIAAWDGWRGSFYRLAVRPDWRRRGLASALVEAGEGRLARLGAVRLTAIVATREDAAMGLWEAVGYERQAKRSRFVRMLDGETEDEA
jgi:ribosomal protein S18 acetylase RimI-like enzyme